MFHPGATPLVDTTGGPETGPVRLVQEVRKALHLAVLDLTHRVVVLALDAEQLCLLLQEAGLVDNADSPCSR